MAYRFASKQRVLAIGVYPATSLKVARSARERAREALAAGLDPSQKKRLEDRRAYARADFWDEQVKMMTRWADKCAAMQDYHSRRNEILKS